jgi:hypothetical protein
MKKYSNYTENDVTRIGFSDLIKPKVNDLLPSNDRFKDNIFINKKEEFESTNIVINSLQSEIIELKRKVSFINEKDKEIYKLKCENKKLLEETKDSQNNIHKITLLDKEINMLHDKTKEYTNNLIELNKIKSENEFLKEIIKNNKINDNKLNNKPNDNTLTEILTDDKIEENKIEENKIEENKMEEDKIEEDNIDNIIIEYEKFKEILRNKSNHNISNKIDQLLNTHNINSNCIIKKTKLTEIISELLL